MCARVTHARMQTRNLLLALESGLTEAGGSDSGWTTALCFLGLMIIFRLIFLPGFLTPLDWVRRATGCQKRYSTVHIRPASACDRWQEWRAVAIQRTGKETRAHTCIFVWYS